MPETEYRNPLGALNPVSDGDAARLVSPETHELLLQTVIAETTKSELGRSNGFRRRPLWLGGMVAAAAVAVVLVIVLPGLLSGGTAPTEPAAAQAKILARVTAALAGKPGTIVVQEREEHLTTSGVPAYARDFRLDTITETFRDGDAERLFATMSYLRPGYQLVVTRTQAAIYDPSDKTIYTAPDHIQFTGPAFQPTQTSALEQELRRHLYRLGRRLRVDGRPALTLVPVRRLVRVGLGAYWRLPTLYVSPRTYLPIRAVTASETADWLFYKVLPATPANRRLLSLTARHPEARIARSSAARLQRLRRAAAKR